MTLRASRMAVVLLLCSLALPAWSQQYHLYESKPVTAEEQGGNKEGVLVTEVPIQKGDTLYHISRKFSGHGMYYPQILLFNKIKDPNLIYPGNTLRVPVLQGVSDSLLAPAVEPAVKTKKSKVSAKKVSKAKAAVPVAARQPAVGTPTAVAPVTEISLSDLKALDEVKPKKRADKKMAASGGSAKDKKEKSAVSGKAAVEPNPAAGGSIAGQKLFESAVKAYRQDDFSTALELFDRYLVDNAGTPVAADASLYKAECYLKLSAQ